MTWFWPALAVLALWGGITMWRRAHEAAEAGDRTRTPATRPAAGRSDEDEAIDWETLEAAEREVKDLGPGEEPHDWGPGAPPPPPVA